MRRNAITGEPVLEMDARGHRLAAREIQLVAEGKWGDEGLYQGSEPLVREVWALAGCPESWDVTIEREAPQEFPLLAWQKRRQADA